MTEQLRSAARYKALSAAISQRAVTQAADALATAGATAAVLAIQSHQAAQVVQAARANEAMLAEQGTSVAAEGAMQPLAFVATSEAITSMLDTIDRDHEQLIADWRFSRLVASLVQDAGRAAQGVNIASRRGIGYARVLTTPSCSRCAVLAGRVYRWNASFDRHPGCDCTAVPSSDPRAVAENPAKLVRDGHVTGLSKADRAAIDAGADFNQIANAKRGLQSATIYGRRVQITTEGTTRRGLAYRSLGSRGRDVRIPGERYARTTVARLTPNEIYRQASSQADAIRLLKRHGYIH